MASTSVPSAAVQSPPSPYSFPVVPSPGPISPNGNTIPLANQAPQPPSPDNNRRLNLPASPMSNGSSPPVSPFAAAATNKPNSGKPQYDRYESVDSTYSDGDGMPGPLPLPFLKTAMSRGGLGGAGGSIGGDPNNSDMPGNRLTSAKRTVSWADLTNTGTALTQVKEYQPECPPASPLSDSSWEQTRPGCFCSMM